MSMMLAPSSIQSTASSILSISTFMAQKLALNKPKVTGFTVALLSADGDAVLDSFPIQRCPAANDVDPAAIDLCLSRNNFDWRQITRCYSLLIIFELDNRQINGITSNLFIL